MALLLLTYEIHHNDGKGFAMVPKSTVVDYLYTVFPSYHFE